MYLSSLKSGLLFCFLLGYTILQAQVVYTNPFFPTTNESISIFFNADEGNGALANFTGDVYAHTGLITSQSNSPSDWKFVVSDWATDDAKVKMTRVNTNLYQLDIASIRDYYGVSAGEDVLQLAFVFRDRNGNTVGRASDGSDIFYDVYPDNEFRTRFLKPEGDVVGNLGNNIEVFAAASKSADLKLYDNNDLIASANSNSLEQKLSTAKY